MADPLLTVFDQLSALSLHPDWMKFGYVDNALIERLYADYRQNPSRPAEHFRIPAYAKFFRRFQDCAIPATDFSQYLALLERESDRPLADAALSFVVEHAHLTSEQFSVLESHPLVTNSTKHLFFLRRNGPASNI
jgi:hypothetical protein